jgi:hypothetical protein
MILDYQSLVESLDAAVAELARIPPSVPGHIGGGFPLNLQIEPPLGPFVAALFRVTKLLFDSPLCVTALAEERLSRQQSLAHSSPTFASSEG